MAERFARGGRLFALAATPEARSDARHVAVEFVHPVIVGKRALPALALVGDPEELIVQAELLVGAQDILFAFGPGTGAAIAQARGQGALTLAFRPGTDAECEFSPAEGDPDLSQELVETLYHVLWELVHVFFEHRGLLSGRTARPRHDAGASAFLYPFLDEREQDLESVVEDVRRSVLMKAREIGELRQSTLADNAEVLESAAIALREGFARGGKLLALGNGGSATDAMDVVADFRRAGHAAIDLTDDPGILTAIANDVGSEAIFLRQVIAHGQPGDTVLAFSTSGGSANVLAALAEARHRGLTTIAMVGYGGGTIARDGLADHVVVVSSEHIPRIQEAQASAYHVLRELVG
ncbi:MAG TPA: SIS domain-containing protein [Solirubrobacteraceae bacterium]|nr:SIS domain-containing protein [Solirubrobacteraceae bacterium]